MIVALYIYLHDQRKYIQECRQSWLVSMNNPIASSVMHLKQAAPRCFITQHDQTSRQNKRLEREGITSSTNNRSLDLACVKKTRDSVRSLSKRALLSNVLSITKVVARLNSITSIGRVQRLLRANENIVLHKQLRALTSVDAIRYILVVVVVKVTCAEAERGAARVQVGQVVVGVGDGQVALVLGLVGVGVANQGGFPVVVQEGVGHGDEVGGVRDVEQAVVVVLVMVAVGGEVEVVDPDVLGLELM
jgi:hypothetical protein